MAWAPQEVSQVAFLGCPIYECLLEGPRGGGKTAVLIMDWYQHVGQGYGSEWRGILFRRSYPELQDVIEKTLSLFAVLCPSAKYNRSEHYWTMPQGEKLFLRHFEKPDHYWNFHGHSYTWIGWEELCLWPNDECLTSMMSTSRSSVVGIPIKVRATTNPYGVGHNWVKARYRLPITSETQVGPVDGDRVAIHSHLAENKVLLHADPNYIKRIISAARNAAEEAAWVHGDWDIVAGGMFDDIWDKDVHFVQAIPLPLIPKLWRIDRSYDHGQSKPFSVGWWATSNGEPFTFMGRQYGTVPGDLYRVAEWYGCTGKPDEGLRMLSSDIGRGIAEREERWGISGRVFIGPADSSIFDPFEPGKTVAGEMRRSGIIWESADKSPGSRKQGWQLLREMLAAAKTLPREEPGLFVFNTCFDFKRTFPVLPRSPKDLDDVDTEAEDHIGDECRYRVRRRDRTVKSGAYR